MVFKTGTLSASGAYLATSPGGLNAIASFAAELGDEAPLVTVYQMVRLYVTVILASFAARIFLHH